MAPYLHSPTRPHGAERDKFTFLPFSKQKFHYHTSFSCKWPISFKSYKCHCLAVLMFLTEIRSRPLCLIELPVQSGTKDEKTALFSVSSCFQTSRYGKNWNTETITQASADLLIAMNKKFHQSHAHAAGIVVVVGSLRSGEQRGPCPAGWPCLEDGPLPACTSHSTNGIKLFTGTYLHTRCSCCGSTPFVMSVAFSGYR